MDPGHRQENAGARFPVRGLNQDGLRRGHRLRSHRDGVAPILLSRLLSPCKTRQVSEPETHADDELDDVDCISPPPCEIGRAADPALPDHADVRGELAHDLITQAHT